MLSLSVDGKLMVVETLKLIQLSCLQCICEQCLSAVTHKLLFAGDVSSGKSTLVDKMCQLSNSGTVGGKFPLSGCSLEYRFIDIQDEETEGVCVCL